MNLNYKKPSVRHVLRLTGKDSFEHEKLEVIVGDVYDLKQGDYAVGDCILLEGENIITAEQKKSGKFCNYRKTSLAGFSDETLNIS